jgi:hypothetical protein
MVGGLGQMATGGAVVGFVVTGEERPVLLRLGPFVMSMVGAVAVMMLSGFRSLMARMMLIARPVGMASRSKQTVGEVQEHGTEGDDSEVLAEHGSDSKQSAAASQLQLSCINTFPHYVGYFAAVHLPANFL